MAPVPQGAQRSEDGYYWWDGSSWQEVPEEERTSPQPSASAASTGDAAATPTDGAGAMTHEELAQITSEDQLDDRSKPYFEPDYDMYPDDDSAAEGGDLLSDEPTPDATAG
jgi:hypothetical protein